MTNKNNYYFIWEDTKGEQMQSPYFPNRSETNAEKQLVKSLFKGKIIGKTLVKTDEEIEREEKAGFCLTGEICLN